MAANAVELTAAQAAYIAEASGAGSFPWVLAVTPPYTEAGEKARVEARLAAELVELGVRSGPHAGGTFDPAVTRWIATTCRARRWLELRFVRGDGSMLRGFVARPRTTGESGSGQDHTVVALRSGGLITFTELDIDHPQAVVPVLTAGLARRAPAVFDDFAIPARIGARADEQLRNGADLNAVADFLGIPESARPVVEAAFAGDRTYVEIVAGDHRDGHRVSTDVGVSVVDTTAGRVLVAPSRAFDGEWVSTFTPGTPLAIATAVERLTETLPDGPWFPRANLTRDFDQRTDHEECRQTLSHHALR